MLLLPLKKKKKEVPDLDQEDWKDIRDYPLSSIGGHTG